MKSNFKIKISLILLIITANSCSLDIPSILSSVAKPKQENTKETNNSNNNEVQNKDTNTNNSKTEDNEKIQIQEVRDNIKTFKDMLETYANKKDGYYPESVDDLYSNASQNNYWKELKNPYSSKTGTGINGSFININEYKNYTTQSSLKGLVVYESLKCKDTKDNCNYKVYGTDKNGALLE